MKTLLLSTSTAAIALISSPAMAASKIVSINELAITTGRFTVQVPAGDGIVLDLSEVGQTVKGAVFGDATKFVISGIDGQLCYMQKDKCEATGAAVVSLRQVNGIEIATQSHSLDGSTTVTLTTDGKLGPKVLHMLLIPAVKAPYTAIVARKDVAPVQPAVASRIESPQLKPHKVNISELPNVEANLTSKLTREQPDSEQKQIQVASSLGKEDPEPTLVIRSEPKQFTPLLPLATGDVLRAWSKPVSRREMIRHKTDSPYLNSLLGARDVGEVSGCPFYAGIVVGHEHSENGKPNSLIAVTPTFPATTYEQIPQPVTVASQQLATATTVEHQPLFSGNNIQPYQAEINVATVSPISHTTDSQKALPPAPQKTLQADSSSVNSDSTSAKTTDSLSLNLSESNSVNDGYSVALGLIVAKKIGWIKPQTLIWNKAQKVIALLLQGEPKPDALHHARLEPQDLDQLLAWGKTAMSLWRQGENLASITDIVRANVARDSERALLVKQLLDWKTSSL